jgi:hypothetical protein
MVASKGVALCRGLLVEVDGITPIISPCEWSNESAAPSRSIESLSPETELTAGSPRTYATGENIREHIRIIEHRLSFPV